MNVLTYLTTYFNSEKLSLEEKLLQQEVSENLDRINMLSLRVLREGAQSSDSLTRAFAKNTLDRVFSPKDKPVLCFAFISGTEFESRVIDINPAIENELSPGLAERVEESIDIQSTLKNYRITQFLYKILGIALPTAEEIKASYQPKPGSPVYTAKEIATLRQAGIN